MENFLKYYDEAPNELTVAQTAKILKCSTSKVYNMFADKGCKLNYYKIGSQYWVPKSALRLYIYEQKNAIRKGGNEDEPTFPGTKSKV